MDEKGRETRYEYGNNLHLLTHRINPDGSELRYHYDHHRFLLTAIENERGEEYRIDYYPNGLVREERAFDGHRTAYQYDLNGHLIEKAEYGTANEVLQTTAFERDEQGRLTKKVLPDGREVRYAYNPDGKLLAVDDGNWPLAFEYDQFGLLEAEHQGWASLHYRYDEFDRLNGMVLPDGQRVDYLRDATGLLSGLDLNGEELTRHRLSATDEELERHQGDLVSAYEYDEEGRLTRHRVHQQSLRDIAAQRDYQYDPHGNLHEQLIHDPAGNLLEQTSGTTSSNKANVRGNRLTMHGDSQYEYDEFGNLIEERRGTNHKLVTRYSYDCEHRLTSVTTPEGSTWHYEYDAFGRRIAKTNGLQRTEFLWQGDRMIAEESDDQYRSYLYEPDSFRPLALLEGHGPDNAQVYYYHLDHLGTPQELTNKQGQLVWSVTYRAYGNVVKQQVAEIENPIRFQGQYHDPETGQHYNRHRYYNPNTGRFITPDPIGLAGGLNNYQYVPNPTGWVDPLGLASRKSGCPGANDSRQVPLSEKEIADIAAIEHGSRPNPSDYLPDSYIEAHLAQFSGGGSRLTPKWALDDPPKGFGSELLGRPDGEFIMPASEVDDLLRRSRGRSEILEQELGLRAGSLANVELVRINVPDPRSLNIRMATGNESGANEHWIPGGKLPTGYSEAVIDRIPRGSYSAVDVSDEIRRLDQE